MKWSFFMAYKYKYKGSYEYTECWKKKCWAPKNWCFWNVVLEKTLESPLDCKEIQPAHPKGNQSWIFIGRTDAEAEVPVLWHPDVKNWLIGKDPDSGQDWRQEEKGMTEDEMVGWHHWLDGLEFEQALGIGDGQGGLVCWSPWGHKELDMAQQLNWTKLMLIYITTFTRKNNHTYKRLSSNGLYIVGLQEIYVELIIDDKLKKYKTKSIVQKDY